MYASLLLWLCYGGDVDLKEFAGLQNDVWFSSCGSHIVFLLNFRMRESVCVCVCVHTKCVCVTVSVCSKSIQLGKEEESYYILSNNYLQHV